MTAAVSFFLLYGSFLQAQENDLINALPKINPWLLYDNGNFADWLGKKYLGKLLREPINVIIVDSFSDSEQAAVQKVMKECKAAGYAEEWGHTSGYAGIIDDVPCMQIPNNKRMAFANKDFYQVNNHGRIIGPVKYQGAYYFVAAFSRESPSFITGLKHLFVSFNAARDDFAAKMDTKSVFKIIGKENLGNVINGKSITTADHDGAAVVLSAEK